MLYGAIGLILAIGGYQGWLRRDAAVSWVRATKEHYFPTPTFSHNEVLKDLVRLSEEINDVLRLAEVDKLRCQRLLNVSLRHGEQLLERDDLNEKHKQQVDRLLLRVLTIGCEINPLVYRRRWQEHCQKVIRESPGSVAATQAATNQLAYRHMKEVDAPLLEVISDLRQHAEKYPKNTRNVQLYLGVANRRVELGRGHEAAMIVREGVRRCSQHPNVGVLQTRLSELKRRYR